MPLNGNAGQQLRPGLDVSLRAVDHSGGRSELVLGVRGDARPAAPLRSAETSWSRGPPRRRASRSIWAGSGPVTTRAIDAAGRWGGSSVVVARQGARRP